MYVVIYIVDTRQTPSLLTISLDCRPSCKKTTAKPGKVGHGIWKSSGGRREKETTCGQHPPPPKSHVSDNNQVLKQKRQVFESMLQNLVGTQVEV